jgi:large subunit ribosomal protein L18
MANNTRMTARRKQRTRIKIRRNSGARPRLSVFRSGQHIYVQLIDDKAGSTVATASTVEKKQRTALKNGSTTAAAKVIGTLIAERALKKGVKEVVFDRGGFKYHGRIKALAEAAREGGLSF